MGTVPTLMVVGVIANELLKAYIAGAASFTTGETL